MVNALADRRVSWQALKMNVSALTPEEIERYARHIVLRGLGGPGQNRLKQARVLVIGAGGLGSPLIQYLAAAGVGTLGIVDDDRVSLSNLQRQVLHTTASIGDLKTRSAETAARHINPHVTIEAHSLRITQENAGSLIERYDIVADGSDNFETRYIISDACFHAKRPLVTAAVNEYDGSLTTIRAHETDETGHPRPTYRCLFPHKPAAGIVPTCSQAGVLGALCGIMGSLQAMEIIREITGFGTDQEARQNVHTHQGLVGRMLLVDALYLRFETIQYAWDPANPLTGTSSSLQKTKA
jgi:molybdopterin-synthase adenylyltransferase